MMQMITLDPIDYLVIGHLTVDRTERGLRLGGTAAYASLTAHALGLRVGIVTAWGGELSLEVLAGLQVVGIPAEHSTTFENSYQSEGRIQKIYWVAPSLEYRHIPEAWRQAPIVHLGPVAQELDASMVRKFPSSLVGLTPQGWLRSWDGGGRIVATDWPQADFVLPHAGAVVIGMEDIQYDEECLEEMVMSCSVLAATEGAQGARLFWNRDVRRFRPPAMEEIDPTGAGDIFAAAFFVRLYATRDPWEAARFATQLSARSVARPGLEGIPIHAEIQECMVEVL